MVTHTLLCDTSFRWRTRTLNTARQRVRLQLWIGTLSMQVLFQLILSILPILAMLSYTFIDQGATFVPQATDGPKRMTMDEENYARIVNVTIRDNNKWT